VEVFGGAGVLRQMHEPLPVGAHPVPILSWEGGMESGTVHPHRLLTLR
jgi:hypothetical protein